MNHSPRWQFSLFTLLALTAVVAATAAAVSSPPNWFSGLALGFLSFAFPVAFTLVIVYGEGYWRAFCIGALAPSLEGWIMSGLAVLWVTVETFVTLASVPAAAVAPTPAGFSATYTATVTTVEYDSPDASVDLPSSPAGIDGVTTAGFEAPALASDVSPPTPTVDSAGGGDGIGATSTPAVGSPVTAAVVAPPPPGTITGSYGVDYNVIPLLSESFARLYRVGGAVYWTFAVALGLFAVVVRWLIERAKVRRVSAGA
ncbi:MAG TPA: hypothetical protein VGX78_15585 [Pirellulales bacterium]|jgi:hypothetical protein|nr:hypothetical protein [Pirellulales bacterium]